MSTVYKLPLVLEAQPEGGYTVTCPLLPELITEGDSVPEVIANAGDALVAIIEAFEDLGRPLPTMPWTVRSDTPATVGRGTRHYRSRGEENTLCSISLQLSSNGIQKAAGSLVK